MSGPIREWAREFADAVAAAAVPSASLARLQASPEFAQGPRGFAAPVVLFLGIAVLRKSKSMLRVDHFAAVNHSG